ncbi:hypothetical protein THAOC_32988, partial [Thalassiosira oceanica]
SRRSTRQLSTRSPATGIPPIPTYDADPPLANSNDTSNAVDAEYARGAAKRQKVSTVESALTSSVLGRTEVLGHIATL